MWAAAAVQTDARKARGVLRLVKQLLVVRLIFEVAARTRAPREPSRLRTRTLALTRLVPPPRRRVAAATDHMVRAVQ